MANSDRIPSAPTLSTGGGGGYQRGKGGRSPRRGSGDGGGRSLGMNFMVALLIAGLVIAGWFIANQQQQLAAEQRKQADAEQRLEALENRLRATDESMVMEGQDTKQAIGLWESEIRKLWAVSNERNKKWIKDNQTAVANISKTINGIESTSRNLRAAVDRHESAFDQQQALIDQLASLELQMQQLVRGQRDLVDKVNVASQGVATLRANLVDKVDDNSEAIAAIDAYRVAVNSRLADMERRLNTLGGVGGGR